MSEPFLAEVRMVGFNFAPRGWASCDGQILPINQNQSLFSLLGTIYGGDGRTTFALPDLRGRTPIHFGAIPGGTNRPLGQRAGSETSVLTADQVPQHSHTLRASSTTADSGSPSNHMLAASTLPEAYREPDNLAAMAGGSSSTVGAGQGHENMQPWLAVNFCIALQGLFPSRN